MSAKWTVLTLIVFTQVNGSPTMLFYSLVFLLLNGSEPMGILQPSILIPFIDDWVSTWRYHASKIAHEYNNK